MARTRGRPKKNELVDMASYPAEVTYLPPPSEHCEELAFHAEPVEGHRLAARQAWWRGKVVDFAVNHAVLVDGTWRDVARIDCVHGTVHHHQFTGGGANRVTVLTPIPVDHGEDVVDEWFDKAWEMMENGWQEQFRRWSGD